MNSIGGFYLKDRTKAMKAGAGGGSGYPLPPRDEEVSQLAEE